MTTATKSWGLCKPQITCQSIALLLPIMGLVGLVLYQSTFKPQPLAAQAEYIISRYEASFEPIPNQNGELRDVSTLLLIEYDISSSPKSDGIKFVRDHAITDVSVTNIHGEALTFQHQTMNEPQINWELPTSLEGKQSILVKFTIKDGIQGTSTENYFVADWTQNWNVPLGNTKYWFIFPDGFQHTG